MNSHYNQGKAQRHVQGVWQQIDSLASKPIQVYYHPTRLSRPWSWWADCKWTSYWSYIELRSMYVCLQAGKGTSERCPAKHCKGRTMFSASETPVKQTWLHRGWCLKAFLRITTTVLHKRHHKGFRRARSMLPLPCYHYPPGCYLFILKLIIREELCPPPSLPVGISDLGARHYFPPRVEV